MGVQDEENEDGGETAQEQESGDVGDDDIIVSHPWPYTIQKKNIKNKPS